MALKAFMGNRPLFDEDGFVQGAVKSVETHTSKDDKGEWDSLNWAFETAGTLKPFQFSELTGMSIYPPDSRTKELNKLTSLVIRLGILTMEDLWADELPDHDLESAIGKCVRFKIYRK